MPRYSIRQARGATASVADDLAAVGEARRQARARPGVAVEAEQEAAVRSERHGAAVEAQRQGAGRRPAVQQRTLERRAVDAKLDGGRGILVRGAGEKERRGHRPRLHSLRSAFSEASAEA